MNLNKLYYLGVLKVLILINTGNCRCQNNAFSEECNFSFEKVEFTDNPWNGIYDTNGTSFFDGRDYTEGNYSVALTSRGMLSAFYSSMFQYMTLPVLSDKIEVTIDSKSQNIGSAWLKVTCLNKEEEILLIDSVSIISPSNWKNSNLILQAKNIQYLFIEINVKSISSNKGFKKQNIDNLNLKYDMVGVNDLKLKPASHIKSEHMINMECDTDICFDSVDDFRKYKILALGESVHGSDECQELVYEIIKYQIKNNNCRLVMFEMPFNLGLLVNGYINGEPNIEIQNELMIYNSNIFRFINFLDWVKVFNSKVNDKVLFLGTDNNIILTDTNYLEIFFKNQTKQSNNFQSIYDLIATGNYEGAVELFTAYNPLNDYDKKMQEIIIYELKKIISERNKSSYQLTNEREKNMFRNAAFCITKLLGDSSTAVIYSHLAHVNKINTYLGKIFNPSFGYYMKEAFVDQYYVIALLIGEGEITSNEKFIRKTNCKIDAPIENSLERMCGSVSQNDFYYKLSDNISSLTCRIIGLNNASKQFYPNSAFNRFDALFYIRNSRGFEYPENWPDSMNEFIEIKN